MNPLLKELPAVLGRIAASKGTVDDTKVPYGFYKTVKPMLDKGRKIGDLVSGLDVSKPQTYVSTVTKLISEFSETSPKEVAEPEDPVVAFLKEKSLGSLEAANTLHPLFKEIYEINLGEFEVIFQTDQVLIKRATLVDSNRVPFIMHIMTENPKVQKKIETTVTFLAPSDRKKKVQYLTTFVDFYFAENPHLSVSLEDEKLIILPVTPSEREYSGPLESLYDTLKKFKSCNQVRRIIIHGPPGSGKTTLNKSISRRISKRSFYLDNQTVSDISKTQWDYILRMFRPDVLCIEDIDRIGSRSNWLLERFEDDHYSVPVTLMTTNHLDRLQDAFKRPGRVDEIYEVPDMEEGRRKILVKLLCQQVGVSQIPPEHLDLLSEMMNEEVQGAHIKELIIRAKVLGWGNQIKSHDVTFKVLKDLRDKWNNLAIPDESKWVSTEDTSDFAGAEKGEVSEGQDGTP